MSNKAVPGRDGFTFSLRGLTTIASFVPAPVIADDRIRQARSNRRKRDRANHDAGREGQTADCGSAA